MHARTHARTHTHTHTHTQQPRTGAPERQWSYHRTQTRRPAAALATVSGGSRASMSPAPPSGPPCCLFCFIHLFCFWLVWGARAPPPPPLCFLSLSLSLTPSPSPSPSPSSSPSPSCSPSRALSHLPWRALQANSIIIFYYYYYYYPSYLAWRVLQARAVSRVSGRSRKRPCSAVYEEEDTCVSDEEEDTCVSRVSESQESALVQLYMRRRIHVKIAPLFSYI